MLTTPEQIPPRNPELRPVGSLIAVSISIVIAAGGLVINTQTGWIAGLLGMPVVAALGWRMSDEMAEATGRHVLAVALWFGARTILLADAIVVGIGIAASAVYGLGWVVDGHGLIEVPLYVLAGALILVALGALYFLAGLAVIGLPMLAVVLPAAIVWAIVFRAVITRRTARVDPAITGQATRAAS